MRITFFLILIFQVFSSFAQNILVSPIITHENLINDIAFSEDDQFIVSCSNTEAIVWNITYQKPVGSLPLNDGFRNAIALCQFGGQPAIAVGGWNSIEFYHQTSMQLLRSFPLANTPVEIGVSGNHTLSIITKKESYDIQTNEGTIQKRISFEIEAEKGFIHPKNGSIIVGSGNQLSVYKGVDKIDTYNLDAFDKITEISCDDSGQLILVVGANYSFILNLAKGTVSRTGKTCVCGRITPEGKLFVRDEGYNQMYELSNDDLSKTDSLPMVKDCPAMYTVLSPNGSFLAAYGFTSLCIWHLPSQQVVIDQAFNRKHIKDFSIMGSLLTFPDSRGGVYSFDLSNFTFLNINKDHNKEVVIAHTDNQKLYTISRDHSLRIAELETNKPLSAINYEDPDLVVPIPDRIDKASISDVMSVINYLMAAYLDVAIFNDKNDSCFFNIDSQLYCLDLENKNRIEFKTHHQDYVKDIKYRKGWLATASLDRTVNIYRPSLELTYQLKGAKDRLFSVEWINDSIVAAGGVGELLVWNIKKQQIVKTGYFGKKLIRSLILKDQYLLLTAENEVHLLHPTDLSKIWSYVHDVEIRKIDFLSNGNFLLLDENSQFTLLDPKGKIIVQFIFGHGSDYSFYCYTPDNYYFGDSRSIKEHVNLQLNGQIYEDLEIDKYLNRPDIILNRIGLSDQETIDLFEKSVIKRTGKQADIKYYFQSKKTGTSISLKNQSVYEYSDRPTYTLKGIVHTKHPVYMLDVYINGVQYMDSKQLIMGSKDLNDGDELNLSLPLSYGENNIQIIAYTSDMSTSIPSSFRVFYEPKKTPVTNLYLITIGASKYQDSTFNLKFAEKDSKDILEFFRQNTYFDQVNTLNIINEDVSRENILGIRKFIKNIQLNDVLMITYSGHGVLDENLDYYLCGYETDFMNPKEKAIPYSYVEDVLAKANCRSRVLFLDACHSGLIDKDEIRESESINETYDDVQFRSITGKTLSQSSAFELQQQIFLNVSNASGADVISASAGGEFAIENGTYQNGLFTYALLSGLSEKRADLNEDGKIFYSELREYITQTVINISQNKQHPGVRTENLYKDVRIW